MDKPIFLMNGQNRVPHPNNDLSRVAEQALSANRNVRAELVTQRVGRRRIDKFENLEWLWLTAEQFYWLQDNVDEFTVMLTFWDTRRRQVVNRRFYFGNLSFQETEYEDRGHSVLVPTIFRNVSVNMIDKLLDN